MSEQVMMMLVVVGMVALHEMKLQKDFENYYTEHNNHHLVDKEHVAAIVLNLANNVNEV